MNRDPVASLQTGGIPQKSGKLIDPDVEFLIGDVLYSFFFQLRNKVDGCFVSIFGQMPVDTVITGVQLAALEPFKTRCIT
ncbi:MAG: hypothetical protein ACD_75C00110G0002 [uncultured bacterium]|nr:MAG: hypothetical protein ACD_75C00110G0002 [uncultured bacterium]